MPAHLFTAGRIHDARPALFYTRAATCWRPQMKGLTLMVNSVYNGSRFEDLWLDN